jgi:hypothetical protein
MPIEKQRKGKKSENEEPGERHVAPRVTAADFNHSNHILVTPLYIQNQGNRTIYST